MPDKVDDKVLVDMYGGRFRLSAIVQKRLRELVKGARPLVDVPRGRRDLIQIVLRELSEGRIEPTDEPPPEQLPEARFFEQMDEG